MNEKSSYINLARGSQSTPGVIEAARFVGSAAGIPIGIIRNIRSDLRRIFNRWERPQRIVQLEKRLAELEQMIHELGPKALPVSDEFTQTINLAREIYSLDVCDPETLVLDTIFRHNVKLQKSNFIDKY